MQMAVYFLIALCGVAAGFYLVVALYFIGGALRAGRLMRGFYGSTFPPLSEVILLYQAKTRAVLAADEKSVNSSLGRGGD